MMQTDMTRFVPRGYRNGISRDALKIRSGLNDRNMRESIEWTSENVETVFSYNGRYFLYGGDEDRHFCRAYMNREKARAATQIRKVRRMRAMWDSGMITGHSEQE